MSPFGGGDYSAGTEAHTLFGSSMGLVAATTGFFTLGVRGREPLTWMGVALFILAFALLIAMNFAIFASSSSSLGFLFAFGRVLGLATGPTVAYYSASDPATAGRRRGPPLCSCRARERRLCPPKRSVRRGWHDGHSLASSSSAPFPCPFKFPDLRSPSR